MSNSQRTQTSLIAGVPQTRLRGKSRHNWLWPWLVLVVVWQVLSVALGKDSAGYAVLPGPVEIGKSAKLLSNYWPGGLGVGATRSGAPMTWLGAVLGGLITVAYTCARVLLGYWLGLLSGVLVAALLSWSRSLSRMFALPAHLSRMLPLLGMIPLFNFWFGASETGAILFVAFATFVVVFPVAVTAIKEVPPHLRNYAMAMGASSVRVYVGVVLPAALPRVRGPALLAVGFAWSSVIGAEFLGAQIGLGRVVIQALAYGQSGILGLAAFLAVAFALLTYIAMSRFIDWLLRWAE